MCVCGRVSFIRLLRVSLVVIEWQILSGSRGSVQPHRTDTRQKTRGDEQQTVRIEVISICD